VAALALKCGDASARGEQSGEMAAGGEAGDTDRCWVDPVVGSISAEPADGGPFAVTALLPVKSTTLTTTPDSEANT
jgi:hypothetical protein